MSKISKEIMRHRFMPIFLLLLTLLLISQSGCDRSSNRIPVSALVTDDVWQTTSTGSWSADTATGSLLFKISGVVSETESKQTLGNIDVDLFLNGVKRLSTRSTSAGTFVFENLPPGLYDVITNVDPTKYISSSDVVSVLADGSTSPAKLEIFLEITRSTEPGKAEYLVSGEIRDERSGATSPGEFIRLVNDVDVTVAATQSDSQGKFVFGKVLAGSYKIVAAPNSDKYSPVSLSIQVAVNGSVSPYPLLLMSQRTDLSVFMSGQVILSTSKEPLGGMTVSLSGGGKLEDTLVNSGGKFFFENLLPNTYSLRIASSSKYEEAEYVVTILSDGTISPEVATIELTPKQPDGVTHNITGKVVDAYTGSPLDFVTCSIRETGSIITDLGGSFYFDSLEPGNHRLDFEKSGFSKQTVAFTLKDDGDTFPTTLIYRLVYNQEKGKGSIVGRIVKKDSNSYGGVGGKIIRVYELIYVKDIDKEKIWKLNPRPIKETRSNTGNVLPTGYSEVGAFKLTHLNPTSNEKKYLVYVGDNDNDIATHVISGGVASITVEDITSPNRLYSWSEVEVFADTSTYLTNYEPHN